MCDAGTIMSETTETVEPPTAAPPIAVGLTRDPGRGVFGGVAAGIAARAGVETVTVRAAFAVLTLAGGVGLALYGLLWMVTRYRDPLAPALRVAPSSRRDLAVGLMVAGALFLLRALGVWLGDELVWPLVFAVLAATVVWSRGDESDRENLRRAMALLPDDPVTAIFGERAARPRIIAGATLSLAGLVAFLAASEAAGSVLLAVLVTVAGLGLLVGPFLLRLARQVTDERNARIRADERAEVAAHLHDSVLQTLALIQRTADPQVMASLARTQERELRTWLYGRHPDDGQVPLGRALEALADDLDRLHRVPVEVVVVGDGPLDEPANVVLRAIREAASNAARHSGAAVVSVYVERTAERIEAFVRDEGKGFDLHAVGEDRRGLADSVIGRLERHGGTAEVCSAPGEGTEVHLILPTAHPDLAVRVPDGHEPETSA